MVEIRHIACFVCLGCLGPVWAGEGVDSPGVLRLEKIWELSLGREPGYRVGLETDAAARAEQEALWRARWPEWSVAVAGDYGQRARPGDERREGVSGRGDVVARAQWTFWDSGRGWLDEAAARVRDEALAAGRVFDVGHRAVIGRAYIASVAAGERAVVLEAQWRAVEDLARRVRRRMAAGVEPAAAEPELVAAEARASAVWREAVRVERVARQRLSAFAGEAVQPAAIRPEPLLEAEGVRGGTEPESEWLHRQARSAEARAQAMRRAESWQMYLVGAGGQYVSPAFEDGDWQEEYYVGIGAVWRPDAGGERRWRAQAEQRRAQAQRAAADSREREAERARERLRDEWREYPDRLDELAAEQEAAEGRRVVMVRRWQQGLESWTVALDAVQEAADLELRRIDLLEQTALELVDYAVATGAIDRLPQWLGQAGGTHHAED